MSREMKELLVAFSINDIAISAMIVFEPVYFYTLGWSVSAILFFYALGYLLYFILLPVGGKIAKHFGFEHSMFYSSFFLIVYYLFLYLAGSNPFFFWAAIPLFTVYKVFYWPSFNADFALFGHKASRGRATSGFFAIDNLVYIIGPFLGGLLIEYAGFPTLFFAVATLIVLSNLPMLTTKERFVPEGFDYVEAFKRLFSKHTKRKLFAYLGYGEEALIMFVWPIFMFKVVESFSGLGSLTALSTLFMMILLLVLGKFSDTVRGSKRKLLTIGVLWYALTWLSRIMVQSFRGIFFVDSSSRLSKNILLIPLYGQTVERAKENHLVRDIIFYEMSLTLGKISACLILAVVFWFEPGAWNVAWVLGALYSLLFLLYRV
ncbi:MAG TPA: MFS transporter [Patescibacteria group bacterium]|nr:MFS transporter [Patescibacteria group bacterium]